MGLWGGAKKRARSHGHGHDLCRLPFAGIEVGTQLMTRDAGGTLYVEDALGRDTIFFPPHHSGFMCAKLNSERFERQSVVLAVLGKG